MKVPQSMEAFIDLSAGGVLYEGPRSMVQFEVESIEMISKEAHFLVVEIVLKRMFKYHLAATYAPSALLIIVTTMTLFVDQNHYDATIMVHLTTMLVMFCLYQNVSDNMPKTAYLKFIDKWLLFGIVVPFMSFVVETVLMLLTTNDDVNRLNDTGSKFMPIRNQIEVSCADDKPINLKQNILEQKRTALISRNKIKVAVQYVAQILIPLVTVMFFISYIYLAHAYYK